MAGSSIQNPKSKIENVKQLGGQVLDPYLSDLDIAAGFRGIGSAGVASSRSWNRDLYPLVQDKMIELSWYLYDRNPLAKRLVDLMKVFITGEGMTVKAEDPNVQDWLDDFWHDPQNSLDMNLPEIVKELSIFGEQIYHVSRNPIDGSVRLWSIDPWEIFSVSYETGAMKERSISIPAEVWLRQRAVDEQSTKLRCIRPDEDPNSETFGLLTGDCFYWAINKAKRGARGRSDIFAHADWLDLYEQLMFDMADHGKLQDSYIWDVTLAGMQPEEIAEWLKKNGKPPLPNTIRAHNERVVWDAKGPDLKGLDRSNFAKMFATHIIGTMGYPTHWFGEGDRTNRATAQEMGWPTFKTLEARQRYFKYMLTSILNYVIDSGIQAGSLAPDVDRDFQIQTPDLAIRDTAALSTALPLVTNALSLAKQEGWISNDTAAEVFGTTVSQLGVAIDVAGELAKMKTELSPDEKDYEKNSGRDSSRGARNDKRGGGGKGAGSADGGEGAGNMDTEAATSGRATVEAL